MSEKAHFQELLELFRFIEVIIEVVSEVSTARGRYIMHKIGRLREMSESELQQYVFNLC